MAKLAKDVLLQKGVVIKKHSELPRKSVGVGAANQEIDLLIQDSKNAGYDSVIDYLKDRFKNWDNEVKEQVIREQYEKYLEAIQLNQEKPLPFTGKWSEKDNFIDFLEASIVDLGGKIRELNWKIKSQVPSFPEIVKHLPDMKDVPKGVGEPLSREHFEFLELIMRKTMETFEYYIRNTERLTILLARFNAEAKQRVKVGKVILA